MKNCLFYARLLNIAVFIIKINTTLITVYINVIWFVQRDKLFTGLSAFLHNNQVTRIPKFSAWTGLRFSDLSNEERDKIVYHE